MKIQVKLCLAALLVLAVNSIQSQNLVFGASANLGLSKITSNFPITSGERSIDFAISGNLGLFMEKQFGNNSSIIVEALWVQIQGKESTDNRVLTNFTSQGPEVIGSISDRERLHSSYLGIPIYYRHKFGKIGIRGGVQTMLFLFASLDFEASGVVNNEPYQEKNKTDNVELDGIDFGPKLGLDYQLNSSFRIRADYFYGIIDITPGIVSWERKNRQISVGLDYSFNNKN